MTELFSKHEVYSRGEKRIYNGSTWTYNPIPIGSVLSIGLAPSKFNQWEKEA